jgi:hypothetical protein
VTGGATSGGTGGSGGGPSCARLEPGAFVEWFDHTNKPIDFPLSDGTPAVRIASEGWANWEILLEPGSYQVTLALADDAYWDAWNPATGTGAVAYGNIVELRLAREASTLLLHWDAATDRYDDLESSDGDMAVHEITSYPFEVPEIDSSGGLRHVQIANLYDQFSSEYNCTEGSEDDPCDDIDVWVVYLDVCRVS